VKFSGGLRRNRKGDVFEAITSTWTSLIHKEEKEIVAVVWLGRNWEEREGRFLGKGEKVHPLHTRGGTERGRDRQGSCGGWGVYSYSK